MFELTKQTAKIAHVNLREEKHGEEDVLACDLKIEMKMGNDFLSQLHPTLKWSLYDRDADQLNLDEAHLPKLRYPKMTLPLKWDGKIVGGKVTIHAPISEDDLVFMSDVSELRLSPQEGGTVVVGFRAQWRPDGDQAAQTPFLLGKLVEISVTKPVAEDDLAGPTGPDNAGGSEDDDGNEDGGDAGGDLADPKP